jgi:anti-anti-sigma factor
VPPPSARSPESETGPWFFCLRHDVHAGAIGIAMLGELDIAAADDARDVIARAQADAMDVICDLHDVSFIDAHGLHVLLDAATGARLRDARFTLVNPSASVRRLIDLLGLEAVLRANAMPSVAPPPIADRRPVSGRAPFRSTSPAAKAPKRSRRTLATNSTPLDLRPACRAARPDRRR